MAKPRSIAVLLAAALGVWMVGAAPGEASAGALAQANGAHASATQRDLPSEAELAELAAVTIVYPASERFAGWELGWKLANDATSNPVTVVRHQWRALAEAVNSAPMTPEGKVESRRVGKHVVLIRKVAAEGGMVEATLYLPSELVRPQSGKYTLGIETNFQRLRNSTQELTTWPVAVNFGINHAFSETRSFEWKSFYKHTKIDEKKRESFKDENGDVIRFSDIEAETIQDSRAAGLDLAFLFTVAPESSVGRVDTAILFGGGYEKDEINLLKQRVTPYAGFDLRMTSNKVDDRSCNIALTLLQNIEEFIIIDTVTDDSGAVIGTVESIEKNELPSWEVRLGFRTPLYRYEEFNMILFEGQGSFQQALEVTEGTEGRPDVRERRSSIQAGISVQTPMGGSLKIFAKLDYLTLPGEASERIDDFQWNSGFSTAMKFSW